jgi:plasmid stabilization system protein ParE
MKFQVVVTARAKQNLRDAYSWAAERAPHTAAFWLQRFEKELQTLEDSPDRFSLAHENAFVEPEIRQMIFGRRQGAYRVLFTVLGNQVQVLHIRRAARDWATPDDLKLV